MNAAMVLPLAFGGLSLISMSMHRHARDVGLTAPPSWLRGLGWAAVLVTLVAVPVAPNWRFALVEWAGLLAAAAALVVLALHWRPRALPVLAVAGGVIGLGASLLLFV